MKPRSWHLAMFILSALPLMPVVLWAAQRYDHTLSPISSGKTYLYSDDYSYHLETGEAWVGSVDHFFEYYIYHGYYYWDTSDLPSDLNVTRVIMTLATYADPVIFVPKTVEFRDLLLAVIPENDSPYAVYSRANTGSFYGSKNITSSSLHTFELELSSTAMSHLEQRIVDGFGWFGISMRVSGSELEYTVQKFFPYSNNDYKGKLRIIFYSETPFPTQTPTFTQAPTPTSTPTMTATATPIPSSTPTATASLVPTATPTSTPTPTSDITLTPTQTPTITSTPTFTLTQVPTMTPSATPTSTALCDIYEPLDNACATSIQMILDGRIYSHKFCYPTDIDFGRLQLYADSQYTIWATPRGEEAEPYLFICTTDIDCFDEGTRIVFSPPENGFYCLRAISGNSAFGDETLYDVQGTYVQLTFTPTATLTATPSSTPMPPGAPDIHPEPPYTAGHQNTIFWSPGMPDTAVEYLAEAIIEVDQAITKQQSGWIASCNYTFTQLQDGVSYGYRVKGRNQNNIEGDWSIMVSSIQDASEPQCDIVYHPYVTYETELQLEVDFSDALSGFDHYNLYYKPVGSASWSQYNGAYSQRFIMFGPFPEPGHGWYELYTLGYDKVQNPEQDTGITEALCNFTTPSLTPTSSPTRTHTPTAPTGTPTPSFTPTITRTMTPSSTPTTTSSPTLTMIPSQTPTSTATSTPDSTPVIFLAGYMETNVAAGSGGVIRLIALVQDQNQDSDLTVYLTYQGIELGIILLDNGSSSDFDPGDDIYGFMLQVSPPLQPDRFLIQVQARNRWENKSYPWPALEVPKN